MSTFLKGKRALALTVTATLAGCGGDNSGPTQSPLTIVKAPTKSGDAQTGPVGQALPNKLGVLVTRDGLAVPQVDVTWSTSNGSLDPTTVKTDDNGVAASTWTLGGTPGQQTATAGVTGATGSPLTFTATAIVTGPGSGATVQVISSSSTGINRFSPADITVNLGETVTWTWADELVNHNVVPDDGATPATSGTLTTGPHTYQYTFNELGTFHYYCQAHGGSGGVGMSGSVTVVAVAP
jgi:plastocyanin